MTGIRELILAVSCLLVLSACNSSGGNKINETLAAPKAAQSQSGGSNTTNTTALAASDQPSAAENVANAQIGDPATTGPSTALAFLPVQGAPQDKVTLLSKSLKSSAESHNLTLLSSAQAGAPYQVKGYFSALSDGSGTLLVYIWDVMDGSGKRLHRINGQERAASIKTDPWQAITDVELQRVADATAARLKSWIDGQPKNS